MNKDHYWLNDYDLRLSTLKLHWLDAKKIADKIQNEKFKLLQRMLSFDKHV